MLMDLNALKLHISVGDYEGVNDWIASHYTALFNPTFLKDIHTLLGACDNTSLNNFSRLIKAWIAFTYGDNIELSKIMLAINRETLTQSCECSLMDALYALCGDLFALTETEKMTYGKRALSVLNDDEESLFYANANLTLGQLCASQNLYRDAADYFQTAHAVFGGLDCVFLMILADVNRLINLFKLGAYHTVIDDANRAIHRFASFTTIEAKSENEDEPLHTIYHLPIGMSLVEMGKLDLSLHHLNKTRDTFEKLAFFHMHGLVEWTYLKALFLKKSYPSLTLELARLREKFGAMHAVFLDAIFDYYDLLIAHEMSQTLDTVKYQKTVMLLEKYTHQFNMLTVEMMVTLQLHKIHVFFSKDAIIKLHASVSNFGLIPLIAMVSQLQNQSTHDITDRELDILALAAKGLSNDAIGKTLFITTGTVKWHLNNLYSKLDVKNRVQAIEEAKRLNIIR